MASQNYRDLIAWRKAMELVTAVYNLSRAFPHEEIYGLTAQIRRAAVSIPSNIAEGEGRGSKREFAQFLRIAHGSLREVETQILIAQRLSYIAQPQADTLMAMAADVGRLINGLLRSLAT